jgi:uncharacterized protein
LPGSTTASRARVSGYSETRAQAKEAWKVQRSNMASKLKRTIVLVIGWSLVVLGVLGLFLPVLQGVLLLLAGLSVLSSEYVWAHKILQRLRARFPRLSERLQAAETWVRSRLGWIFSKKSNDPGD